MGNASTTTIPLTPAAKTATPEVPFGVNEVRLNARHWLIALVLVTLFALFTPRLWQGIERFDTGPDYRLPYPLSRDYWLYGRRLSQVSDPAHRLVLGDSVVWGEYVMPEGTLSHFLNKEQGETDRFINGGVNGLFPLALEGLIRYHATSLRNRKVMVQCNVLWMTSPKADLSSDKEEAFNHARLVPQFYPRIPCYRADANERLSAVLGRQIDFLGWVNHIQDAYFGQKSILQWTLESDNGEPPRYPNSFKNPLRQITLRVPSAPQPDQQRGPNSPRHKSWSTNAQATTSFEWVTLESSVQWGAFQRLVQLLRERGNDVLVLVGPFNEHMILEENRAAYRTLRAGIVEWLARYQVYHIEPEMLPSALYADASHPLTDGYQVLARRIVSNEVFHRWDAAK